MNPDLATKMLRYVQLTSVLTKRALDERNALKQDHEKAAELRATLISEMLGAAAIGEHQQKQAQEMLGTHAGTAKLLKAAVARIAELSKNQKQAGDLGEGVDPTIVGGNGASSRLNRNYVGERTSEKKASDLAMLRILDAPSG